MDLEKKSICKLGIMGGAFDPIQFGHLAVAEFVISKFDLEKVVFVSAFCPPHKLTNNITDLPPENQSRFLGSFLA